MRKMIVTILILSLSALPAWGAKRARSQEDLCTQPHQDVSTPLNDLGAAEYIRMGGQNTGFSGGLYPQGSNQRPPEHEAAGVRLGHQITPLDASGNPNLQNGEIVMLSIGVSNTFTEFEAFGRLINVDPQVNPRLTLINGAQHGRTSDMWIDPAAETWQEVLRRVAAAAITPQQVQVAWIKHTRLGHDYFPTTSQTLQSDLEAVVRILKTYFPNLKIAYLSSRTRSHQVFDMLAMEPHAFETGFAVKWLIEKQINGDPTLNYDPSRGEVVAPYLSWGPYLWIDGLNPRSDGRIWRPEDLYVDCVHPSQSGAAKVADMLMEFFKNDTTTRPWFLADQAPEPTSVQLFLPSVTTVHPAPPQYTPQPSPLPLQPAGTTLAPRATTASSELAVSSETVVPSETAAASKPAAPPPAVCGVSGALTALVLAGIIYWRKC